MCLIRRNDQDCPDLELSQPWGKEPRTSEVGRAASGAAFAEVRHALPASNNFAKHPNKNGAILDGRDIGTVVLPHADAKFMLMQRRISGKRRYLELSAPEKVNTQKFYQT